MHGEESKRATSCKGSGDEALKWFACVFSLWSLTRGSSHMDLFRLTQRRMTNALRGSEAMCCLMNSWRGSFFCPTAQL